MTNITESVRSKNRAFFLSFHERSGLTWEQSARMFGVSKNTVHMWSVSGSIPESKLVVIRTLSEIFNNKQVSTGEQGLKVLMTRQDKGYSLFNQERAKYASTDDDINRTLPTPK